MLFNSLSFIIFFPIVTILFYALPHKFRWFLLLSASCFFYMCYIPQYIIILFITILIDYFAAIFIEKTAEKNRKSILIVSILSTCAVLFIFKYFNFFNANFAYVARIFHLDYPIQFINIILPIGLSFHTFQSLSYVIEVYRRNQKAEKNFGIYALYVMFYPQLVAGPIERPQNLLHQFYENHKFDYHNIVNGLKMITWGMFKKVVIADRLAIVVNQIYNNPHQYQGMPLIAATIFFSIQIYCDFSGYSDIARGTALSMGFKLMNNFNKPYFSKSIAEFWKRWHISLSSWFRDYVYISLGGNRVGKIRHKINLLITFLISGFWHGANWTYVIWGGLNGFYLLVSDTFFKPKEKMKKSLRLYSDNSITKIVKILITYFSICLSWIFFRSRSLQDAFYIINNLFFGFSAFVFNFIKHPISFIFSGTILGMELGIETLDFFIIILIIIFFFIVEFLMKNKSIADYINEKPTWVRWSAYFMILFTIIFLGNYSKDVPTEFIYFKF